MTAQNKQQSAAEKIKKAAAKRVKQPFKTDGMQRKKVIFHDQKRDVFV